MDSKSSSTTSLNHCPSKSAPSTTTGNVKKLSRCLSEPRIIPRQTKLSLKRKSLHDLGNNVQKKKRELAINERNKLKYPCPRIVVQSCLDGPSLKNPTSPPSFSPLVRGFDSWLKKRNKKFTSFVGLRNVATKDPTSFINLPVLEEWEGSSSSTTISSSTSTVINGLQNDGKDIKMLLESALNYLSTLIRMGYPIKDCENWLTAMGDHYPDLIRYPLYWECRASINSKMGMESDVENDNNDIAVHINDLVNKVKHLNVETVNNETPKRNRVLADIDISFNNVITSSTIQFSVKTPDKEEDRSFVVTPVRRSARKSQCAVQKRNTNVCVPSLLDLTDDVRENMKFEPNLALK